MSQTVANLQKWFDGLSLSRQKEVVRFLYEGKGNKILNEGVHFGPKPHLVGKGLFCGPKPSETSTLQSTNTCPTCGKRL